MGWNSLLSEALAVVGALAFLLGASFWVSFLLVLVWNEVGLRADGPPPWLAVGAFLGLSLGGLLTVVSLHLRGQL